MRTTPLRALFVVVVLLLFLVGGAVAAWADSQPRTWNYLTTGNGHGFQVYDATLNKVTYFLEHPYRYLRQNPSDPMGDGIVRRNLAYDFYFGVRGSGGNAWLNGGTAGDPEYLQQTNIIHVPLSAAGVSADTYYFAPFGYEGNALIALLNAPSASDSFVLFNFHMGSGSPDSPDANGESLSSAMAGGPIVIETGPGGGAMVYVPLTPIAHADCNDVYNKVMGGQALGDDTTCSGNDVVPGFEATPQGGWTAVAVLYVDDPMQAATAAMNLRTFIGSKQPADILAAALSEWQTWRKPPPMGVSLCTDDENKLWRQSEAVLRMGQIREPFTASVKNNGMILASLPIGEWHTGWVRDAMYAIVALSRMGHFDEARMALQFFLNAAPVGQYSSYVSNQSYRISVVRYYGDGQEEADYSGQPTPNIEIDGWGMFMWAVRQYVEASGDTAFLSSTIKNGATVWDTIVQGVAQPLSANLESSGIAKADSSIWEVHDQNKKHYAYTSMAAIRGFCDLAALAQKSGRQSEVAGYANTSNMGRTAFFSVFLDQNGAIAGSIEGLSMQQYVDAAAVESFNWNIIHDSDYAGQTSQATLNLIGQLRVQSGGFKRNDNNQSSYDNNEWILIDMRMSDAYWRTGQETDSKNLLQLVIDKAAANFYLLPELYNAVPADGPVGSYTGSIPMVGYGGGAYVLTMFDRSGLIEPNDCGDGAGNKSSGRAYQCSTDAMIPDGGISSGSMASGSMSPPYEDACLCQLHPGTRRPAHVPWFSILFLFGLTVRRFRRRRA